MDTPTKNATTAEQTAAKKAGIGDVKGREKYQSSPFRPKATLLLDVSPVESAKPADTTRSESPEGMLQQLLLTTEASAQRTQFSRRKWQLASLMLGMLLVAACMLIGWLYVEMNVTGTQRDRLAMENQSLKEQLNLAGAQITEFKNEVEMLLGRNIELAAENAKLKSQSNTSIAAVLPAVAKAIPTAEQTPDAGRVETIKKGTFPNGTTRAELTAALGEPDHVYKSRNYELLVYLNRKPGRFWFAGSRLVQVAE